MTAHLPVVWILTKGADDMDTVIVGVYASKLDARADFEDAAGVHAGRLTHQWQDPDGEIGCRADLDYIALAPHRVQGQAPRELEAGR
ncbi:hypothetical protein [Streptomyces sp. STCH 565 A]|uniref:hypothetical protein n=1 Tax=Streptomyces sp. STCH 565 A TaxID=2950532 RepID=UPI002075158A|nr:hypothetical protein [Streptomyces sp. STCH 565 A]MCM8548919.1 hypothetical protein [Streptomyces sp. STCH 565 A]